MDIRPKPEQCIRLAESAGFTFEKKLYGKNEAKKDESHWFSKVQISLNRFLEESPMGSLISCSLMIFEYSSQLHPARHAQEALNTFKMNKQCEKANVKNH